MDHYHLMDIMNNLIMYFILVVNRLEVVHNFLFNDQLVISIMELVIKQVMVLVMVLMLQQQLAIM